MDDPKKIFWLASYPKSGNTLMRAILSSLFFSLKGEYSNKLLDWIESFETCARLKFIEKESPQDIKKISDLNVLSKYWQEMQSEKRFNIKESFCFIKTHSALVNILGNEFTNKKFTRGLIYIVRDPRDVVLSWSNHRNKSIDDTLEFMLNINSTIAYNDIHFLKDKNLKPLQYISSWNTHFNSWKNLKVPKMIIRFEDLIEKKEAVLKKIISFFSAQYEISIDNVDIKIENILRTTDFNFMKNLEEKFGFKEALNHTKFFNVGKKNQWKDRLTLQQAKKIEKNFKKEMEYFNYL
tara:strand:+ start:47 stop:928 length:882 start_codon:yes stop_codon:yes gene_type:complete